MLVDAINDRIKLYSFYDTVIPILLVAISAGSIIVVFVNQNLRIRTEELRETRKKKAEEVLYEVITDYVITFDKNNRLEDCNKKFLDALGFSKDELIGKHASDLLVEEEREMVLETLQRIENGEQIMEYHFHVKIKDGGVFHSIWNAIPMYDNNNDYMGFVSTGISLTEIDRLRDELVKKEKMAALLELKEAKRKKTEEVLYEVIPDYVVTIDNNDRIKDCNKKVVDAFGYSKDEIIGMPAIDFMIKEDKKAFSDVLQRIHTGEQVIEYDLHIKRKDGRITHSIWNCMPMYDESNEYIGYMATGVDLTEIDKLRDELVKKEKLAVLGQLAANIAHDIKNPLTVIKISTDIIKKTDDKEIKDKQFQKITRGIQRIVHQVDDVLEYVGFTPLQFSNKSIREILISSYDLMPITDNIRINFPDNDIKIECDDKKLERLFVNIFLNATQAIGSDKGSIDVRINDKDDHIEIECENSGPAIDEEILDKIFEPLFTTKMQGTGLGLSSVKSIIESHGGKISVTSPPVIFTITLPKSQ